MVLVLAAFLAGSVPVPPETLPQKPWVVRLSVDLIQLDAVVTDKKGQSVTDLTAADFEVWQDGRRQAVTQVAYVGSRGAKSSSPSPAPSAPENAVSREAAPEALVFVVDDLGLSLRSVVEIRNVLMRFADGIDPASSVFLLRTGDRFVDLRPVEGPAELRAAARALAYHPLRPGADLLEQQNALGAPLLDPRTQGTNLYLNQLLARQSLLSVQDIVDALRGWKGRKTVVLFSEGFPLWDRVLGDLGGSLSGVYGRGEDVLDAIDRLTDIANRASVVIHTIDPRGLVTAGLSASDSVPDLQADRFTNLLQTRRSALQSSQASLSYVAGQTGGLAVDNSNDMAGGVAQILSDRRGYYLVGYEPEGATFGHGRPRFHKLAIKVKRPGLKVRSRKGFFGLSDDEMAALAPPHSF